MKKIVIISAIFLVLASPSFSEEWKVEFTKDGITVSTMPVQGSDFRAFRGETVIDAKMEIVKRVLDDVQASTEWLPDCIQAALLQKRPDGSTVVYNQTKAPIVSNRDVVVESRAAVKADRIFITLKAVDRPDLRPEINGIVRIKDMDGKWYLERRGEKTYVLYQVRANPGGGIPAWLANSSSKDMPLKTLKGLRSMSAKPKYQK